MIRKSALFTLSAVIIGSSYSFADDLPGIVKLNESAQQAFDQGKFKKAEASWTRTIKAMQENGEKDSFLETCFKRLGQTYKRLERTVEAYRALSQALEMCRQLNLQDAELAQEMTDLSKSYRPIDLSELGEGTAKALRKANVTSVGLVKTSTGSMMRVELPEKFEKQLDSDTVDGLSFDKAVTLDLAEDSDGTVSLKNIQGMRIHAKEKNMWVNLLQAVIKPADAKGEHPADVTAGKMGVTKTVSASLPAKGFEPLNGLLKELRLLGTPIPLAFTGAADASAAAVSAEPPASETTAFAPSGAEIVPAMTEQIKTPYDILHCNASQSDGAYAATKLMLTPSVSDPLWRSKVGELPSDDTFSRLLLHEYSTILLDRTSRDRAAGPTFNNMLLLFMNESFGKEKVEAIVASSEPSFGKAVVKFLGVDLAEFAKRWHTWLMGKVKPIKGSVFMLGLKLCLNTAPRADAAFGLLEKVDDKKAAPIAQRRL